MLITALEYRFEGKILASARDLVDRVKMGN
jgi:hypothetical protein